MRSLSSKIYLILVITLVLGGCQINQKISLLKKDLLETNEEAKENLYEDEIKELKNKNEDKEDNEIISDDLKLESKEKSVKGESNFKTSGTQDEEAPGFLELNKPREEDSEIRSFFSKLFGPKENNVDERIEANIQPAELREISPRSMPKDNSIENNKIISDDLKLESKEKSIKGESNFKTSGTQDEEAPGFLELNKPREEDSEIRSFFSKLFGSKENNVDERIEANIPPEEPLRTSQEILEKESINLENKQNLKSSEKSKFKIKDLHSDFESFDEKDEEVSEYVGERDSKQNLKEEKTAFFQLKKPLQKTRKKKSIKNNLVGILIPLTGNKKPAGELVVNTLRYNILKNPTDLIFKIYDTQGTPNGAVAAAKKGIDEDVNVFIGPIFSDETKILRDFYKSEPTIFFSLSTDTSNNSENVIITGQSPEGHISCITQDIIFQEKKKVLLIYHNGKYGEIVKKSLFENVRERNYFDKLEIDFFEVGENENLNEKIKVLSDFENRKRQLESKLKFIEEDIGLSEQEKKFELKKLDKKLTLGDVPFDAIIIASEGDRLLEILSHLAFYDINTKNTLIYGTGLWENTEKKEIVYQDSFFATDLKNNSSEFIEDYKINFEKEPSTAIFHLVDLIEFVKDFKESNLSYPEDKVYNGEFSNSVLRDGLFLREVYIKKISKNSQNNITSCPSNVL